jgi:hypothetical protein
MKTDVSSTEALLKNLSTVHSQLQHLIILTNESLDLFNTKASETREAKLQRVN